AAKYFYSNGKKVGVITNDQGTQQVDTLFIRGNNIPSEEVSGGCFCCNYKDLEESIHSLNTNNSPDIIFAESVGSCTDLAATVINPLLHFNPGQYEIVLSVFADVRLLIKFLQNAEDIFYDTVNYIYEKQLEEADIIVVNKIDLLNKEQLSDAKKLITAKFGNKIIHYQNSLSKKSIRQWMQLTNNNFHNTSLRSTLDIDYDIYGAGEAELAWLDEELGIVTKGNSAVAAGYLLIHKIYSQLTEHNYPIGHLKFLMDDGKEQRKISFNAIAAYPDVDMRPYTETDRIILLINARVQMLPVSLEKIVADAIIETEFSAGCRIIESNLSAFKPGYPRPTHRIAL
ncbi:MAG: CobW-like GTP-binding protein, partial [Bacteroidota bacterium]|nr:CobW-like GTP-binding protein [Bacteroidota bacterium]